MDAAPEPIFTALPEILMKSTTGRGAIESIVRGVLAERRAKSAHGELATLHRGTDAQLRRVAVSRGHGELLLEYEKNQQYFRSPPRVGGFLWLSPDRARRVWQLQRGGAVAAIVGITLMGVDAIWGRAIGEVAPALRTLVQLWSAALTTAGIMTTGLVTFGTVSDRARQRIRHPRARASEVSCRPHVGSNARARDWR